MMEIISRFREKPKTKIAWHAMWLGLSTLLVSPILGINAAVIRPATDKALGATAGTVITLGVAVCAFALAVVGLVAGIRAFKKGERSWVMWVGFVPAIFVGALLIFMVVGEFIAPHE